MHRADVQHSVRSEAVCGPWETFLRVDVQHSVRSEGGFGLRNPSEVLQDTTGFVLRTPIRFVRRSVFGFGRRSRFRRRRRQGLLYSGCQGTRRRKPPYFIIRQGRRFVLQFSKAGEGREQVTGLRMANGQSHRSSVSTGSAVGVLCRKTQNKARDLQDHGKEPAPPNTVFMASQRLPHPRLFEDHRDLRPQVAPHPSFFLGKLLE